jgi:hypothetical protein
MKNRLLFFILLLPGLALGLSAQEDDGFGFGFGFGDGEGGGASSAPPLINAKIGGKVSAGLTAFPDDFVSKDDESALDRAKRVRLHDIFSGELNFSAAGSNADGVINLKLAPNFTDPAQILSFDEAYIRAFFGNLTVEGGLRKLSWGRADSFGPLDIINPLDYRDLSRMNDFPGIKIARPMIRASWGIGSFTKIEGVFLPWFEGYRFAGEGRWMPAQMKGIPARIEGKLMSDLGPMIDQAPGGGVVTKEELLGIFPAAGAPFPDAGRLLPDTSTLEYFQGGLRFTTTFGPADFGAQYYYGFRPRPSYRVTPAAYTDLTKNIIDYYAAYMAHRIKDDGTENKSPEEAAKEADVIAAKQRAADAMDPAVLLGIAYNRCHQIGVDYSQVLFGFNTRAELAANITGDLSGDDGLVYNPALVWSLGFDRDIPVLKINVNLQADESVRLLHNRLGNDPLFDVEAGKDIT